MAAVNFEPIICGQGVKINLIQTQIPRLKAVSKIGWNIHNTIREIRVVLRHWTDCVQGTTFSKKQYI